MIIRPPTNDAIDDVVARLRRGELIGLPTETVYGLAADAENVHAVAKIFALKGRPATHPVIVHVASVDAVDDWSLDLPADARRLLAAFAPGPLTLIVRRSVRVPDVVTGGQDTVGIRIPSHPVAQRVLRAFGGGIAAPSANRFGRISATRAEHVVEEFGGVGDMSGAGGAGSVGGTAKGTLELVLDGGPCDVGIESTIVDVSGAGDPRAAVLRPGGIPFGALERVLGYAPSTRGHASPRVSGDLPAHYAPQTPTRRVVASRLAEAARTATAASPRASTAASNAASDAASPRVAVLARTVEAPPRFAGIWRRAPLDPAGYARSLYAELRVLDAAELDLILVESPPDEADWQAINDRLSRATHDTESRNAGVQRGTA